MKTIVKGNLNEHIRYFIGENRTNNVYQTKKNKENKLAPKYYGPHIMLQRIGSMYYKLEFPPSSCLHKLFHVSFLKR